MDMSSSAPICPTLQSASESFYGLSDSEDESATQYYSPRRNRPLTHDEALSRSRPSSLWTTLSGARKKIHLAAEQKRHAYQHLQARHPSLPVTGESLAQTIESHFPRQRQRNMVFVEMLQAIWPWYFLSESEELQEGMQQAVTDWLGGKSSQRGWRYWKRYQREGVKALPDRFLQLQRWYMPGEEGDEDVTLQEQEPEENMERPHSAAWLANKNDELEPRQRESFTSGTDYPGLPTQNPSPSRYDSRKRAGMGSSSLGVPNPPSAISGQPESYHLTASSPSAERSGFSNSTSFEHTNVSSSSTRDCSSASAFGQLKPSAFTGDFFNARFQDRSFPSPLTVGESARPSKVDDTLQSPAKSTFGGRAWDWQSPQSSSKVSQRLPSSPEVPSSSSTRYQEEFIQSLRAQAASSVPRPAQSTQATTSTAFPFKESDTRLNSSCPILASTPIQEKAHHHARQYSHPAPLRPPRHPQTFPSTIAPSPLRFGTTSWDANDRSTSHGHDGDEEGNEHQKQMEIISLSSTSPLSSDLSSEEQGGEEEERRDRYPPEPSPLPPPPPSQQPRRGVSLASDGRSTNLFPSPASPSRSTVSESREGRRRRRGTPVPTPVPPRPRNRSPDPLAALHPTSFLSAQTQSQLPAGVGGVLTSTQQMLARDAERRRKNIRLEEALADARKEREAAMRAAKS